MDKKTKIRQGVFPLFWALGAFFLMLIVGTVGYMLLDERFSFLDAIYMTVVTISTVGFKETYSLSDEGRIFTIVLILSSVVIFGYMVSMITAYIIEGAFRKNLKKYRVNKKIGKLRGHVIVCGYGRNGRQATIDLKEHNQEYVVIDKDEERIALLSENPEALYIYGDATDERALQAAQIKTAKALITAMPSDAVNVYIVLTARELNPNLRIISRCSDALAESKLRRAGADNIIMPDLVGGQKMARLVAQPDIVEFLDQILLQSSNDVNIEEIFCEGLDESIEGKTIKELGLRSGLKVNVIGIRDEDGTYLYNPPSGTMLTRGKQLFVLGHRSQINALRKFLIEG